MSGLFGWLRLNMITTAAGLSIIVWCTGCTAKGSSVDDKHIEGITEIKKLFIEEDAHGKKGSVFVNSVAWSIDGTNLAVLSDAGSAITVYDSITWQIVKRFTRNGGAYTGNSFAFLPDGSLITAVPMAGGIAIGDKNYEGVRLADIYSLMQWDSVSGEMSQLFRGYHVDESGNTHDPQHRNAQKIDKFKVSPDGTHVAGIDFVSNESGVRVFDTLTTKIIWRATIPTDWIATADIEKMTSARWELVECLAFSPDGTKLAVGTSTSYVTSATEAYGSVNPGGGRVHIFDAHSGQRLRSFWAFKNGTETADQFSVSRIVYSPDGQTIAAARGLPFNPVSSQTQSLAIFEARTGQKLASLPAARTYEINGALNFDPVRTLSWYGDTLIAGEGAALRLWSMANLRSPRLLATIGPPAASLPSLHVVWSTAVSRDGRLAVGRPGAVTVYQLSPR